MNEKHPVDQSFRDKLSDWQVPPPEKVWVGVEAALKEKRRRAIWPWLASAAVVTAISISYFSYFRAAPSEHPITSVEVAVNSSAAMSNLKETEANATVSRKESDEMAVSTSTQVALRKQSISNFREESESPSPELPVHSSNPAAIRLPDPVEAVPAISQAAVPTEQNNVAQLATQTNTFDQFNLKTADFLPTSSNLVQSTKRMISPKFNTWSVNIVKKRKSTKDGCYDFDGNPVIWMGDVYAAPLLGIKQLSTGGNPENESYKTLRDQTEGGGLGYSLGLRGSVLISGNYVLGLGVQYDHLTEVFRYSDLKYIEYVVVHKTDPVTGATVLDTIDANLGIEETKIYNRYGLLDIPVFAGWEMRSGKMGLRLTCGASLNLLFHKRGSIINPATEKPDWFTPENGVISAFNRRAGWSVMGNAQLFYHSNPRTRWFVEPAYRKVLQPVSSANMPVVQRNSSFGLRFGLAKIL